MTTKRTIPFAAALMLLLTACDTKSCKCYIYDGANQPYVEIEYLSDGTPCSSLDYTRTTRYRACLEYDEPDIDPSQIGEEYK